jgi:coenzyme F420 hydrogenase subunit beta
MMQKAGANELIEDVHKRDLCIGCGACVELCPYFKNYKGKTSQLFPCTLEQGRCYAYCPKAEVNPDDLSQKIFNRPYDGSPLGNVQEVVAARAGQKAPTGVFQAGGTATALMGFALKNDVIDVAALTGQKDSIPIPKTATHWEEVVRFATSKYMSAPTLSAVNMAKNQGYQRIGIVGTPCQMTAVAQMRFNDLQKAEHAVPIGLSIGLFCNWSLDTRLFTALLSERLDLSDIKRMDIPPPPANLMRLETGGRIEEVPLSDIKPSIPPTCFICLDLTAELADISLGMFEGKPGWNTLIIRSGRGAEMVEQARHAGFIETEDYPEKQLKHLSKAAAAKKARSMRMLLRRELINSQGDQRAAIRIPQQVVDKILEES